MRVMMVSLGFPKGCDVQIGKVIMYKWIMIKPLIIMIMVGLIVHLVRIMAKSLERTSTNLENYLGAKTPNVPLSSDGGNVELKFRFEMLTR